MPQKLLHFPRWAEVLKNSSLPDKFKRSYEITLRWYLAWCHKRKVGCSVDSAHAFVKCAQQEKEADDWLVEQWKRAVQWYFVEGKKQRESTDYSAVVNRRKRRRVRRRKRVRPRILKFLDYSVISSPGKGGRGFTFLPIYLISLPFSLFFAF